MAVTPTRESPGLLRPAAGEGLPVFRPAGLARDVDVVVVAYRSRDLVARALDALPAACDGLSASVTVADNASGDGTVEAVRGRSDGSAVLDMGSNTGFATANNRAMARGSARYVLVLNPDTVPHPGSLRALVAFADAHGDTGVVAPRLLNGDGTPQLTARRFPTPAAAVLGRRSPLTRAFPGNRWSRAFLTEAAHPGDTPFEADWVSGAAMLVPRDVVTATGGFDEGFFLFWEDADWCRRIRATGRRVWCEPSAVVVHEEGGARAGWRPRTVVEFHRGAYRYWAKHHTTGPADPVRWAAAVALALRAGALVLYHGPVTSILEKRRSG